MIDSTNIHSDDGSLGMMIAQEAHHERLTLQGQIDELREYVGDLLGILHHSMKACYQLDSPELHEGVIKTSKEHGEIAIRLKRELVKKMERQKRPVKGLADAGTATHWKTQPESQQAETEAK